MAIWQIIQSQATLNRCGLQACLDLAVPGDGLRNLVVDRQPMTGFSLLGVAIEPVSGKPIDAYVRTGDLVATYDEAPNRPSRVQIYWRAGSDDSVADAPIVDLQVSVQTNELGVPTPIETVSRILADEALQLTNAVDATFTPLDLTREVLSIRAVDGLGCLLFRVPGSAWSYVEMIHPADFREDQLVAVPAAESALRLQHRLFPDPLEKGVILRGQIRAAWVPRNHDQSRAAALYRELVDMPPPLTT